MPFNIDLYTNTSEPNKVLKKLTKIITVSGTLKEATSFIDPVFRFDCDLGTVARVNYIGVPSFGRFYFVKDVISVRNRLVEFRCHVDVLSSFAGELLKNKAIIKKQENKWNLNLNDGSLHVFQNPKIVAKEFPSGLTDNRIILAVAGK